MVKKKQRAIERIRRVTVLGKSYRFSIERQAKTVWATCDSPSAPNKAMEIDPELLDHPRQLLISLIHESLHLGDWHKDEESWVEPLAEDIARILYRVGFRLMDERALEELREELGGTA